MKKKAKDKKIKFPLRNKKKTKNTKKTPKKRKKHIYLKKTGRPVKNLLGHVQNDWVVIKEASATRGTSKNSYWLLEHMETKQKIILRGDNIKNFTGSRSRRVSKKINPKK